MKYLQILVLILLGSAYCHAYDIVTVVDVAHKPEAGERYANYFQVPQTCNGADTSYYWGSVRSLTLADVDIQNIRDLGADVWFLEDTEINGVEYQGVTVQDIIKHYGFTEWTQ